MTSHQLTRPHDDPIFSGKDKQLLSEPENFDDMTSWPFTLKHDTQPHLSLPEPLFIPQAQSPLEQHSEIQHHAHGSNDYPQDGAHSQIQSHPPLDNHKDRQESPSSGLVTGGSSPENPIGELSEQSDNNSAPVQASLLWDPMLAELTIPSTSIDEEMMGEFMHEFKLRTGSLLLVKNLKLMDQVFTHLVDHLPLKIYQFSKEPLLYQIKVAISPAFFTHSDSCPMNHKAKILKQITRLISWLLYLNAVVLRNLDTTETLSTNSKLVDWIFNKIFEPQNSLPVIGRFNNQDIQAFKKGKEFGPVQIMLINLLSSPLLSKREPQTAMMIISNYYENEFPEVFSALKNGQIPDLRSLAIESEKYDIRVGSGFDEGSWIQELGNFPVRSLKLLPETLKPKLSHQNPFKGFVDESLVTRKLELLDDIMQILILKNPPVSQFSSFRFNDSKMPVAITSIKNGNNPGRRNGWVWLCCSQNQTPITSSNLLNKLKKFMSHLNVCNSALLRHMKNTKFEIDFELQPLLINWIYEVVFDMNKNKLPLIGYFLLEDGRSIDSFSPADFNIIQSLLIRLITSQNSHRRHFQAALSVFGYWLKNMVGQIYSQLFKNDEEYWDTLIKIISPFSFGDN
ncbi:hypothetical protein VP01_373g2 [Puccinia sorghi]|uniref:Uncharacterized protein n=1 Tax=Puccinia sorghi TaxID=27349 RepID=A0A0L6UTX1_9BASI|nr:hypothetical protein VP01_373g2 [Puccinia sorghi]